VTTEEYHNHTCKSSKLDTKAPRTINPVTARVLQTNPLPPSFQHYKPLIEQLPIDVIASIYIGVEQADLGEAGFVAGMQAAIAHQNQRQWRCACCYKWLDKPWLNVIAILEERIAFAATCERCSRKYKSDDELRAAVAGYMGKEVRK
jgi:hypothetical protein